MQLICSDVDGTLLDPRQQLTPGVRRAVQAAAAAGVPTLTITGKAIGPWREDVHPYLGSSMPQVGGGDGMGSPGVGWGWRWGWGMGGRSSCSMRAGPGGSL